MIRTAIAAGLIGLPLLMAAPVLMAAPALADEEAPVCSFQTRGACAPVERVGVLVEGTIGNWADMPGRTFDGWTNKMPQRIANTPGTWANYFGKAPGNYANMGSGL